MSCFSKWVCTFPGEMGLSWKHAPPYEMYKTKEAAEAEAAKARNVVAVPLDLFMTMKDHERRMVLAERKLQESSLDAAEIERLRARVAELEASRAELVDIARRYVDECEDTFIDPEEMSAECVALWKDARAALARATGEGG